MPNVIFYREEHGSTPMLDWLDRLPQRAERARRRKQAFEAEPQRHTHKET